MATIKNLVIFLLRLLWISVKYSPILIAWLLFGIIAVEIVQNMISSYQSKPPMSTLDKIIILLSLWFVVTGLAAFKSLTK